MPFDHCKLYSLKRSPDDYHERDYFTDCFQRISSRMPIRSGRRYSRRIRSRLLAGAVQTLNSPTQRLSGRRRMAID